MAQEKRKFDTRDLEFSKKILQKHIYLAIQSKYPVIIGILLESVACIGATPQKKIPNSSISNYKKTTLIVYIVEKEVNNLRRNIR